MLEWTVEYTAGGGIVFQPKKVKSNGGINRQGDAWATTQSLSFVQKQMEIDKMAGREHIERHWYSGKSNTSPPMGNDWCYFHQRYGWRTSSYYFFESIKHCPHLWSVIYGVVSFAIPRLLYCDGLVNPNLFCRFNIIFPHTTSLLFKHKNHAKGMSLWRSGSNWPPSYWGY